jgi:tripartite-type tricarboxylate transporter receptor subunit TctC
LHYIDNPTVETKLRHHAEEAGWEGRGFMKKRCGKGGLFFVVLLAVSLVWFQVTHAQEFPTKPITLIIPFGAGGASDLTARAFVGASPEALGQPVVVQLKPGGGGAIASDLVAKAGPDGYTLLMGGPGPNTTLPAIEGRSRGPDDLAAVCRINYSPMLTLVPAKAPYKTFRELIEYAKAHPGQLKFGHAGIWGGPDLLWKQIQLKAGVTAKMIPYDGGAEALVGLLGGHIDLSCLAPTQSIPHIKAGRLRALSVSDSKRDPDLPQVPTLREEGLDIVNLLWKGVMAPKATPRPVVEKLASAFKKMLEDPSSVAMIKKLGDNFHYLGPDELSKFWREEYEAHKELGKVFKKTN